MNFKWLTVPFSNRTKQVEAVQMWEVRWWSATFRYEPKHSICSTAPELECFQSASEAEAFAVSLKRSLALLRIVGLTVEVTKAPSV